MCMVKILTKLHKASLSWLRSRHNSCPPSSAATAWEWLRAVATAKPHIRTSNRYMHMYNMYMHMYAKLHICRSAQHAHDLESNAAQGRRRWRRRCRWRRGGARDAKVGGRQPDERGGQAAARVLWEARQKLPHARRAAAVRAVAQRQSKKVLAIASLPRSEGSSNHEQRAVCRDGPVWARESCSFTEIYVAGIKLQRRLSMAAAHRTLAGGAHLAVAAVHGLVMEDAARGDGCAIHSSLAVNKRGGGALGRASGRRARAVADGGGRPVAEACRLPRIDFPLQLQGKNNYYKGP